jgi:hypothetical protein
MSRFRSAVIPVVGVAALVGSLLAPTATSVGAAPRPAAEGRRSTLRIRPSSTTKPLRQIARHAGPVARLGAGDLAIELEHLRKIYLRETEGADIPATGWDTPVGPTLKVSGEQRGMLASWEGSNHFDSRYADGGNQFSGEPPDQGLCASGKYVLETVNSVIQIYDPQGHPLLQGDPGAGPGPVGISLNQLYGYPPEFDRTAVTFGPFLFDVSCFYDTGLHRWFHLADRLDQDPVTGDFTGVGSMDLAVSKTPNPMGAWTIYRIPTTNDGSEGTPNHHCDLGPCFGDFPQMGADANGIYLTTNEYSFNGDGYSGAQLYALSKRDLAQGHAVDGTYFQNLMVPELKQKAFTVWGATSRRTEYTSSDGGTAFFVSSTAGDGSETGNLTGGSDKLVAWALTDTSSLNGSRPDLDLHHKVVQTIPYVFPPHALQKRGPTPLLKCINLGASCFGDDAPFQQQGPYPLDGSDTRVLSSFLNKGIVWTTLSTALQGTGGSDYGPGNDFAPTPVDEKVGVAYFGIRPSMRGGHLWAKVVQQGYLGVDNANLLYPSIVMGRGRTGYIGTTLVGPRINPSAAYVKIRLGHMPGAVEVAAKGVAPSDGFTGTWVGGSRPRFGDYGYAVPGSNGTVWFATEYVQSRCRFSEFVADETCGLTRSFFANWSTRVTHLQP